MRKLFYGVPLIAFLVLAGYFALALRSGRDPSQIPSVVVGKPMPSFDLPALAGGGRVSSAALRGHVVLVNFFASWCVPCRLEQPLLMRLASDDKLTIIGIAYQDKAAAVQRLLAELGDPYRQVALDEGGRTGIDFGVYGVPESYLIDRAGMIRKKFVGPLDPPTVEQKLLPLVKELRQP
jgi:cytochrome c biogenesis protein CcmG/thiol:disulfide interchange protein DsbE